MNGRNYVLILFFWALLTVVTPTLVHMSASAKPYLDSNGMRCTGIYYLKFIIDFVKSNSSLHICMFCRWESSRDHDEWQNEGIVAQKSTYSYSTTWSGASTSTNSGARVWVEILVKPEWYWLNLINLFVQGKGALRWLMSLFGLQFSFLIWFSQILIFFYYKNCLSK